METNENPKQKQSLWQKITHTFTTKRPAQALLVIVFVILGIIGIGYSLAYTGSPSSPTASTCGARVQNYTYKVPFGNAVWNQPACNLPKDPRSADYAERLYKWGNLNDGSPATQSLWGDLTISAAFPKPTLTDPDGLSTLFSRNVYNAKDATTQKRIQASVKPSNLDGIKSESSTNNDRLKYTPDATIPWNPNWLTGEGGDNEIVILDESNGRIYEISGYKRNLAAATQCGPLLGDRLCTYSVKVGRDINGNYFDYRTYEGPFNSRGVGLSQYATLTNPQEIAAGEIRHALGIAIPNTAAGPQCKVEQQGTAAEGTACGVAVAPASKFEFGSVTAAEKAARYNYTSTIANQYTQNRLIPEGTRFALNIDDAYIENWINSRPDLKANTRKAQTARIFARALKDYGMIVADTSGNKARIQVAGMVNPVTRDAWKSVGIESDADTNLLEGLITQDKIYVVPAPKLTCSDGKITSYYCIWTKAEYTQTAVTTPTTPPTTPPSITTTPTTPPTGQTTPPPVVVPTSVVIPSSFPVSIGWDSSLFEFRQGASLSWSASTSPKIITNYLIRKNGKVIYNGVNRTYTDFDLYAGQKYKYEFYAVDSAGNISVPAVYERNYTCSWFGWSCSFTK